MNCKKCNKEVPSFANAFHKLCKVCNNKRLEASKKNKPYNLLKESKKSLRTKDRRIKHKVRGKSLPKKTSERKAGKNLQLDELFYEQCFNQSNHKCEECGKQLPTEFRNDDGKIIARFRYSHIVPKSIAPELRHNLENINHLCHEHHFQWDFGGKESMKIYLKNKAKFPQFFK